MDPITLAATPIGNVDDASARLRHLLATADVIAAEDTRRLRDLLSRLGVTTAARVVTYHEHNEAARAEELVAAAEDGDRVVVVSDAGMPGISDPGYRVVNAARGRVGVTCAPGPSAGLAALALSGLPTDKFCFEGFLPRKPGARAAALTALTGEQRTMIFYEAPHRIGATLTAMAGAFGPDRPAAVCRELTKTYEEVLRAGLAELAEIAAEPDRLRGEIVVVVAGAQPVEADMGALAHEVLVRVGAGEKMRPAVAAVAAGRVSKRDLYEAALAERDAETTDEAEA